jgi:hypothetical protein
MAALIERLPSWLKGDERPRDVPDRLALAGLCSDKKPMPPPIPGRGPGSGAEARRRPTVATSLRRRMHCRPVLKRSGEGRTAAGERGPGQAPGTGPWLAQGRAGRLDKVSRIRPTPGTAVRRPESPTLEGGRQPGQRPRPRSPCQAPRGRAEGMAIALVGRRIPAEAGSGEIPLTAPPSS